MTLVSFRFQCNRRCNRIITPPPNSIMCIQIRGLHGLGPAPRPVISSARGPGRQIRDDFSNGPGRQVRDDFSNGPAREKWVLKRTGRVTKKKDEKYHASIRADKYTAYYYYYFYYWIRFSIFIQFALFITPIYSYLFGQTLNTFI